MAKPIAIRTDENWIQTFSGLRYYPTDPRPEDVCLLDVAHHLSNICRFMGAISQFYSVAQHCVLMSELQTIPDYLRMVALLHDAAEAFTGDFARPVKRAVHDMGRLDMLNTEAIEVAFDIQLEPMPTKIKDADFAMLAAERMQLFDSRLPWGSLENVSPAAITIRPWTPAEAKERYLVRFQELKHDRFGWQGNHLPSVFEPETESRGRMLR